MLDYTIVTISNRVPSEHYYCLNEWYKSVAGTNHLVIERIDTPYTGLCDKPKFVYRAIKKGLIKTKYIIFSDCWDLVFCATPEEIIEKYLAFNSDLVISSEKNCFPGDLKEEYDKLPATSSYKYLNSGMIVGTVDSLLTTLEAMEVEKIPNDYYDPERNCNVHFNDQFEYQKIFLKQPVNIKLDYDQILCNTLHSVRPEELDFSEKRIRNKETGSYPCSLHLNGSAKTDFGIRELILNHIQL
jgi:hypothetical protein